MTVPVYACDPDDGGQRLGFAVLVVEGEACGQLTQAKPTRVQRHAASVGMWRKMNLNDLRFMKDAWQALVVSSS